jgi:hypothetical protein
VLADRLLVEQVATAHGRTSTRDALYYGRRFRECLQTLAVAMGATGKRERTPCDQYAELSKYRDVDASLVQKILCRHAVEDVSLGGPRFFATTSSGT